MRARSGKVVLRYRKRLRKLCQGFRASRGNLYKQMIVTKLRAGVFAYRDRRQRRRFFRSLWITRINAACRMRDIQYSRFISGLQKAQVEVDRKNLSEIAIHDPATFDQLVAVAKEHLNQAAPAAVKGA
jgi:large subunit ribosomal protein L20